MTVDGDVSGNGSESEISVPYRADGSFDVFVVMTDQ